MVILMDISNEISEHMAVHYESKSKWVKDMRTRIRVFNGQIFDNIYERHAKDIADMHYAYLTKTFNKLFDKASKDPYITGQELAEFHDQYSANLQKLYHKKLNKTEHPDCV